MSKKENQEIINALYLKTKKLFDKLNQNPQFDETLKD